MSFMLTTNQVENRTKTVTRRSGWLFLKPGDVLNAVEKGQGLKKGERVRKICPIRILSVRREPLFDITDEEVKKEGFPFWGRMDFIKMFMKHNNCAPDILVSRIEFEYL